VRILSLCRLRMAIASKRTAEAVLLRRNTGAWQIVNLQAAALISLSAEALPTFLMWHRSCRAWRSIPQR